MRGLSQLILVALLAGLIGCVQMDQQSKKTSKRKTRKVSKTTETFVRPQGREIDIDKKVLDQHNFEILWTLPIRGDRIAKMYLVGDSLYIFSPQQRFLHRIDRRSGIVKWSFRLQEGLTFRPVVWEYSKEQQKLTGQEKSDEVVVISKDRVYIIDKQFGVELSSIRLNQISPSAPPGVHKHHVYITGWDDRVYGFSKKDQIEQWRFLTGDDISAAPLGAPGFTKLDVVFTASTDGKVYGLRSSSGNLAWNAPFRTYGKIMVPPVYHKSWLYVASRDTNLYCLNPATGLLKWSYICGAPIVTPPVAITTRVYTVAKDRFLYSIHYGSGKLLWKYPKTKDTVWLTNGDVLNGEILSESDITDTVEMKHKGKVISLDGPSIEKISRGAHKVNPKQAPRSILSRGKETLFVLNNKREICALDDKTGNLQWKIKAGNVDFFVTNDSSYRPLRERPDAGAIYLGFKEGWIVAIRERDEF